MSGEPIENRNDNRTRRLVGEVTKRVSIRHTHPNMWRALMLTAGAYVLDGCSYFYYVPTFNPINKTIVGLIYLILGLSFMISLNVWRHLKAVRATTACSVAWMVFWGLRNTEQVFAGHASMALPIALVLIGVSQIPWLVEPAINPVTATDNGHKK